ncbi:hypothetical protein H6P81_007120 [Aristolochia fimbriata]|uniref:Uncharacterized protein n=1 Tax=Aristolochia fimbriata TaxID=158543 RepID=A0AAV7F2Z8_ARIFI|nr:hypothetical protein H6P81_007120 [Aristolochia fimbriata]
MEGDASHMTYCPSGESILRGHAEKPSTLVDHSRSCGFLNRRLAIDNCVFFLSCPDSLEKEDKAARPETFVLQGASWLVNRPPLPRMFEDGQNQLEPTPTVSAVENSDDDEGYDSDRSHPQKRRPKGKKKVATSSVKKKRAPLVALSDTSVKKKKPHKEVLPASFPPLSPTFLPPIPETEPHSEPQNSCLPETNTPIETVHILSSPEASGAPQEEVSAVAQTDSSVAVPEDTEVVEELAEVVLSSTQPEALPVQEVAPFPLVVQEAAEEATIEEATPVLVLQEADVAPVPSIEAVVEVETPPSAVEASAIPTVEEVTEVVPPAEEVPVVLAVEETLVVEAPVPAIREEARAEVVQEETPAVEEVPVVSTLIPLDTPSQQLLSHVEGLMLQVWKDRITPCMLSSDAVRDTSLVADANFIIGRLQEVSHDVSRLQIYIQKLQALREMESLAREKASRTSRDWAKSDARGALDSLTSKLENAETTLGEVAKELSEVKVDEEDARERLELAKEKLQSAETKVAYLATQSEQIRESVRDLKEAVIEAEQKIAEAIARPTLGAAEQTALLSLRADFAVLQQEMRDL